MSLASCSANFLPTQTIDMHAVKFSNSNPVWPQLARTALWSLLLAAWIAAHPRGGEAAVVASGFGPFGESGELHGKSVTFGEAGGIFEMDAFIALGGVELNADQLGAAFSLSADMPQFASSFSFVSASPPNGSELLLAYALKNGPSPVNDLSFFFYIDPEVAADESYADEYAVVVGAPGAGRNDPHPDSWEADEPGFAFGDIYAHCGF